MNLINALRLYRQVQPDSGDKVSIPTSTNLTSLLTHAVGAWLHFEFCCNRSGLFNEKYLSVPIGQLLSSRFGERVHAEFLHPVIAPLMKGPGRRPQIDFAYCDPYPTVKVAVETKWIGRSGLSVADIVWDLIRLELIANHSAAKCIFLIGGRRKDVESLFSSADFAGPRGISYRRPILNTRSNSISGLWLVPREHYRIPLLRKVFTPFQNYDFPHRIITRRSSPFPTDPTMSQYQIYAWLISSAQNRDTFRPVDSKHYRIPVFAA